MLGFPAKRMKRSQTEYGPIPKSAYSEYRQFGIRFMKFKKDMATLVCKLMFIDLYAAVRFLAHPRACLFATKTAILLRQYPKRYIQIV